MKSTRTNNSGFTSKLEGSKPGPDDATLANGIKPNKKATTDEVPVQKPAPVEVKKAPVKLKDDDVQAQKEIAFFKRIHGHLPDKKCGGTFASPCNYMDDLEPINAQNEHEQDLMEYPEYPAKKAELEKRVKEFNEGN